MLNVFNIVYYASGLVFSIATVVLLLRIVRALRHLCDITTLYHENYPRQ